MLNTSALSVCNIPQYMNGQSNIKNLIDVETETLMGTYSWNMSELNKYVWNKLTPQIRLEIIGTTNSAGCLCLTVLIVLGKKNCRYYTALEKASESISNTGIQKYIRKCKPNLFRKGMFCCWFRGHVHTKVLESFHLHNSPRKKPKKYSNPI